MPAARSAAAEECLCFPHLWSGGAGTCASHRGLLRGDGKAFWYQAPYEHFD